MNAVSTFNLALSITSNFTPISTLTPALIFNFLLTLEAIFGRSISLRLLKNWKNQTNIHVHIFFNANPAKKLEYGSPTEYKFYMSININIKNLIPIFQTTD